MSINDFQIRSVQVEDFQALQRLHEQPQVVWGTLQLPFQSTEAWKKRITEKPETSHWLVACIQGQIVGSLSLWLPNSPRRRHVGEIGMVVHDDWHRRGVGTALMQAVVDLADRWLNLVRLELTVYTDNSPALALYRKFGFDVEGTLKNYAFRDGTFVDALAMARIGPVLL